MRSHRCWNAATSARQTTGAPTATLCDWGSARRRNRSAETCCPLSPKELKLCPTGKCQATFANHHRLKGERLDFRRAETLIRINVSQEGGRNPWESGHSQVSWPTPHPLLEVQKNPSQTQQSCAVLSEKDSAVVSFCVSSAPCTLLENLGLWCPVTHLEVFHLWSPVTLLEDQVPTLGSSKAVPLKLHLYNWVVKAHFSFLKPGLEYPKGLSKV